MRIRYSLPNAAVRPDVLNAALETSTRANEALLEEGDVRPISEAIRKGLVRWKPEPFTDGEHFDHAQTVNERGWGDCDDLAPAYAAELRVTGRDPDADAVIKKTGPSRWHAVVRRGDGRIQDPSRAAGMGRKRTINGTGIMGSIVEHDAVVGIKRVDRKWAVRCDLPIDGTEMYVSGLSYGGRLDDTLQDAIEGACVIGEGSETVHPELIARAMLLDAAFRQDDEKTEGYADEADVGFLPLIAALAPMALDLVSKATGGKKGARAPAPAAAAAAAPRGGGFAGRPSGGGGPVAITPYGPGGPVIVRF